uniref:Uncharacterized protein n=1 Tax=Helianthus annuus TaxID=4232 RepID=A0A251USB5_HELAN
MSCKHGIMKRIYLLTEYMLIDFLTILGIHKLIAREICGLCAPKTDRCRFKSKVSSLHSSMRPSGWGQSVGIPWRDKSFG